jgi:CTP-dependent riboflavin kinase
VLVALGEVSGVSMPGFKICGVYVRGVGRASRFIASDPYRSIFRNALGSPPYPGTLNLRLMDFSSYRDLASLCSPYRVFKDIVSGGRVYGGFTMWIGSVYGVRVVVLRPHRSVHPDNVVEVVSSINLADITDLSYGSIICVDLECR